MKQLALFSFSFLLSICSQVQAAELDKQTLALLSMDLASLGDLQVYTASRSITDISDTPSVVTIITAENIRRHGYHNLAEVLNRVPGFFNTTTPSDHLPISNRGFAQDVNTNYLLLLDGKDLYHEHRDGTRDHPVFPLLSQIARIEIIRGPGSTLWGSRAGMGIIHIITKTGSDIDTGDNERGTLITSVNYELEHDRTIANLAYGKQFDEGDVMLDLQFFDSKPDFVTVYGYGALEAEVQNNDFHDKFGGRSRTQSNYDFEPSFRAHFKANYQDLSIIAHHSVLTNKLPFWTSVEGDVRGQNDTIDSFLMVNYTPEINDIISMQHSIFWDESFFEATAFNDNESLTELWRNSKAGSQTLGVESIAHITLIDHNLTLGAKYESLDDERVERQSTGNTYFTEAEKNWGLFAEETYRGIEDWTFTVGTRWEHSDLRAEGYNTFPKAAAIYKLNDQWKVKYIYNTGNVPPSFDLNERSSLLTSQESFSHDLQFLYTSDRLQTTLTFYSAQVDDLITFIPQPTSIFINAGAIKMQGIEFEATYELSEQLKLYGNYAYADSIFDPLQVIGATGIFDPDTGGLANLDGTITHIYDLAEDTTAVTPDGRVTGVPAHIINIGLDWDISNRYQLNIHYRLWADAVVKVGGHSYQDSWATSNPGAPEPVNTWKKLGPEHYMDLNLRILEINNIESLEVAIYAKNIFDNTDPLPSLYGGYTENPNGQQIGVTLKYQW